MKKIALSAAIAAAMAASTAGATTLTIGAGSNFTMEVAPGFHLPTAISGNEGIVLGTSQLTSGGHPGAITGTETTSIDNPWFFFSNTGAHGTQSPTNVISVSGNTATIDMSGWYVNWNTVPVINMGGGAWGSNADGVGVITCQATCAEGETYTLYYTATVPNDGLTNFGGVAYGLNLSGTITGGAITAVPVPAAVWLLGSGLIGLVGVARRRKAA